VKRFKNILLVCNFDARPHIAVDRAVSLAKHNEAQLTVFTVVKERSVDARMVFTHMPLEELHSRVIDDYRKKVDALAADIGRHGVDVRSQVVTGIPFLEIIRQVLRDKHDLVILASEGKGGINDRLFGATSMHLMRKCPCPVWVVKQAQTRPYARILAAVDPSIYDSKRGAINPLILQLASGMARKEVGELHIIHAWQLFGERYVRSSGMTTVAIQEAKMLEKKQHKQRFDTLLNRAGVADLKPYVHLIEGSPEDCIPELVAEKGIDLLVMGTVCRTGIAGFLIGNTAEEVLNQVDCSVLTIKPEGFVTPVPIE
jgi:nucleotide-binding universal stress UspA family protein